ncbi:MAG: primosomal protein N', partial [Candidatus Omnitrophica bacterium]|nr:primosomal protein N' [Candidatus Omnitrophota bacterium]
GLDFPRVSLVGVISADTALNLPDFRSGERTFNLLTQVAGRAGRGEREGKVIIQTYVPEHYAISASIRHDYRQFYRQEIKSRNSLKLPPFSHLASLILRGRTQEKVEKVACHLSARLKKKSAGQNIQILGPAPAQVSKIRGSFLWNVLIKGKNVISLIGLLKQVIKNLSSYQGMRLTVDIDPL